jgi:hypothetical protein
MVMDPNALVIHDLRNGISSIRNSSHAMEEFCTLIAQLYSIDCVSTPPVEILVSQPNLKLFLDNSLQVCFWIKKASYILQSI